jgi:hypothetical protein
MAHWAANWDLKQTGANLAVLALGEDAPECPADLPLLPDKPQETAMGRALKPLADQRFGDYILKKLPRSAAGRPWCLQPVK